MNLADTPLSNEELLKRGLRIIINDVTKAEQRGRVYLRNSALYSRTVAQEFLVALDSRKTSEASTIMNELFSLFEEIGKLPYHNECQLVVKPDMSGYISHPFQHVPILSIETESGLLYIQWSDPQTGMKKMRNYLDRYQGK